MPVFDKMFQDFGSALPGPTQFVVNMSAWVKKYFILMFIALFVVIWSIKRIYKLPKVNALRKGKAEVHG